MSENRNISIFYDILNSIREQYGDDIVFDSKRLKALLDDLNPQFKNEERKFLFLVNENQAFIRNVYQQSAVSIDSVSREIENLCGFNEEWTQILTHSLLTIMGKMDKRDGVSLNFSNEHRDFLYAKSRPEDSYIHGPIKIVDQQFFWVLASVHNEESDAKAIAENVRISMKISNMDSGKSVVEGRILSDNAVERSVISKIEFYSSTPFTLEYHQGSAYMYSSAYGLNSDHQIPLDNDIILPGGTIIGFSERNGKIPGGQNNIVTISIMVNVIYKDK